MVQLLHKCKTCFLKNDEGLFYYFPTNDHTPLCWSGLENSQLSESYPGVSISLFDRTFLTFSLTDFKAAD